MDEWFDEPSKKPADGTGGIGSFILATLFAAPFIVASGFFFAAILSGTAPLSGLMMYSLFLLPFFLAATVGAPICIILAWKKGHGFSRLFLSLYSAAIILYWLIMIGSRTGS